MDELKAIWNELASGFTKNDDLVKELWVEIEKSHTTTNRLYHNLSHLEYMMDRAIKYKDNLIDPYTVLFSIFYHDIVYDPKRKDNEERSACIARDRLKRLGVPTDKELKCHNQILATKDHNDNIDNDTKYFLDFDLAIMGDTPKNYQDYKKKIREEYSLYPDFLYRKGRKKALQNFLDMKRIFKTEVFYNNYEQQAKENIKAELRELS